jgi:hypothetical protein
MWVTFLIGALLTTEKAIDKADRPILKGALQERNTTSRTVSLRSHNPFEPNYNQPPLFRSRRWQQTGVAGTA